MRRQMAAPKVQSNHLVAVDVISETKGGGERCRSYPKSRFAMIVLITLITWWARIFLPSSYERP